VSRLRSRAAGDAGITLVEVSVTMVLGALVLTLIGSLFMSSLRQNRTVTARTMATADARIALEGLTRDLRVAIAPNASTPAMIFAGPRQVTFYASRGPSTATTDPRPSKVDYQIDTGAACLRRTITTAAVAGNGTVSWPAANARSTCLARGVFNAGSAQLFTYWPWSKTGTPAPTAFPMSGGQVSAASLDDIASVQITLTNADTANPAVKPVRLTDQVSLMNVIETIKQAGK
jgi:hypothetical protein